MYASSIALIAGYGLVASFRRRRTGEDVMALLLPLCWFSVTLMTARGAQRYHFFLAPPSLIFMGIALFEGFRGARRLPIFPLKASALTLLALVSILLILSCLRTDSRLIRSSRPLLSPPWRDAMEWMRDNLPEDAVVAAWWHYGSMINVLAHKSTVVDEDHFIPYWIHLISRHLFCAKSEREALELLKAHNVTHVAISLSELLSLPMISWLGSDEEGDRQTILSPLISPDGLIPLGGDEFILNLRPPSWIRGDEPIRVNGREIPKGEWFLGDVYVRLKRRGERLEPIRGTGVVRSGNSVYKLPIREIYLPPVRVRSEGEAIPGCLVLLPDGDKKVRRGIYLSGKAAGYLTAKLLLFQDARHFRRVYPPSGEGSLVPEVQIWRVVYPGDISYPEAYLEREFPDPELFRAWSRGKP